MKEQFKIGDKLIHKVYRTERTVVGTYKDQVWLIDSNQLAYSGMAFDFEIVKPDKIREIVMAETTVFTREMSKYNSHLPGGARVIGYLHVNVTTGVAVVKDHA